MSGARLPRQVKLLSAVSLFNDFASEMIYPLLPAFVTAVLGGGAAALGTLDGAADFAAAIVKFQAGKLADRVARRGRLVVLGYAIAVVVRPVIAITGAAWQVIGLRVVDRVGKGIRTPPRDALIADATSPDQRGRAFGLQRAFDHAGAVLGPLVAWALLASHRVNLRAVIGASIVPGVVVVVLAMWAVGVKDNGDGKTAGRKADDTAVPISLPSYRPTVGVLIPAFYLLRVPDALIILRSQDLGVPVAAVPLLWAAVHVVRSASSVVGGARTDRLGAGRTMWLGWTAYALVAAAFALARTAPGAWGCFLAMGIVAGLTESPERALVARLAGARQGSGFGSYHGWTGLAALAGGVAIGVLYQQAGGATAFAVSAAAGAALTLAPLLRPVRAGLIGG